MNLTIRAKVLEVVGKKFSNQRLLALVEYRLPTVPVVITADQFTVDELAYLEELAKKSTDDAGMVKMASRIRAFRKIAKNPGAILPGKLEALAAAIKALIEPTEHHWVFTESKDGRLIPWFVGDVEYVAPYQGRQAYCSIDLLAFRQGQPSKKVINFYRDVLKGKTVATLLALKGIVLESPELVDEWKEEVAHHQQIAPLTGSQFLATETAFDCEDKYGDEMLSMEIDTRADRVVMDDEDEECRRKATDREEKGSQLVSNKFWEKGRSREDDKELDDDFVMLPLQPYVKVFNFRLQKFVEIHVSNLKPYVYAKDLARKLVLPSDTKKLVGILMRSVDDLLEDIVSGKTGGIIVMATGYPGVGKTLTAEVFAEEIKKPLYPVQCSELGITADELQERLTIILNRATRWKAILLLDEADVYVRARGIDIQQNAIVGVFLRVLEYYKGILFLTSNLATVIDDALFSRVSAWVQYDYPVDERLLEHWRVLSKQFQVPLTENDIKHMAKAFPVISGRTIKNMLKLGRMLAKDDDKPVDVAMLTYAAKFLKLEKNPNEDTDEPGAAGRGQTAP